MCALCAPPCELCPPPILIPAQHPATTTTSHWWQDVRKFHINPPPQQQRQLPRHSTLTVVLGYSFLRQMIDREFTVWAANISSPRPGLRLCYTLFLCVWCRLLGWRCHGRKKPHDSDRDGKQWNYYWCGVGPSNSSAEKETNQRAEGSLDEALTSSNCISINNSCVNDSLWIIKSTC